MKQFTRLSVVLALAGATTLVAGTKDQARASDTPQATVDRAALSVEDIFGNSSQRAVLGANLNKARAVMVCPAMFRVSIGFGGAHGSCVLLARDARGSWSDPAFYKLSTASMGVQFGVQSSQILFFIMTDRGLQALLDSQLQLGSNAGASFANMSTAVASANAGASNTDILVAQRSQGVFAGAALGGSKLTVNSDVNREYYGQTVGPEDIVVTMRVNNPGADPLRRILMRYSTAAAADASASGGGRRAAADDSFDDAVEPGSAGSGIRQESLKPTTSSRR